MQRETTKIVNNLIRIAENAIQIALCGAESPTKESIQGNPSMKKKITSIASLVLIGVFSTSILIAADAAWPAPVADWKAPAAGEHPRLFFRKGDIPELKKRAQSPDGLAIVKRLGLLLDGKDGKTLPEILPTIGTGAEGTYGKAMTLWHPAGYGMLYQLTGDKLYADLGKQAMEHILTDTGDIDGRYGYLKNPNKNYGALRAGPSLGAVAMGYDLCYDGWEEDFRKKVVKAMLTGPFGFPLKDLVEGKRHGPHSNHWGPQIGGGAIALLALKGDPGVDDKIIDPLIETSKGKFITQLTQGFGDGGMFKEGKGAGGIGSDTAFMPAIQAWRVAGGQDFVSPRPNAAAITMIKVHELLLVKGEPWYLIDKPSGYGTGFFGLPGNKAGLNSDRDNLARGGQFAQGFGVIPEKLKPAALWVYNNIVEKDPAQRTFDTISRYPHRAVLALVNWPIGIKEVNPAELIPKVHYDDYLGLYSFRNQWTGTENDIVVNATHRTRDPHPLMVFGKGERLSLGPCPPKAQTTHFQAAEDGSGTLTAGSMKLGVDFSKASGAEALIVTVGLAMTGAKIKQITAGEHAFSILLIGSDAEATVVGDKIVIGKQEISCDGKKIIFGTIAGAAKLPRLGIWEK